MESYEHLLHFVYNGLISNFFYMSIQAENGLVTYFKSEKGGKVGPTYIPNVLHFFKIGVKLKAMNVCYILGTTAELVIYYISVQGRKWPSTKVG